MIAAWLARLFRRWGGEFFVYAWAKRRATESADPLALQQIAQQHLAWGELPEAEAAIGKALLLAPKNPSLWVTKAAVLRTAKRYREARAALDEALARDPTHPGALTNMAELDLLEGDAPAALLRLEAALTRAPDLFPAAVNRIAALCEAGRYAEARAAGEALLAHHPDHPELLVNTANALIQLARGRDAAKLLKKALARKPALAQARYLLAMLVGDVQELPKVIDYLEERFALEGEKRELLVALANAHQAAGNLSASAYYAERLLAKDPAHLAARLTLASIASNSGHTEVSDAYYAQLYRESGDLHGLASNWLFEGNYLPHLPPADLFARHRRYAEKLAEEHPATPIAAPRHRPPLRVGYVSGDFCRHPVGALLVAILKAHDRSRVTPIAFSTTLREDERTLELKHHFTAWHDVFDLNYDDLYALVRREAIDILVDLSGHTAFHRLPLFARRAAPVQVSWIGYFHSTGLSEIDYLLTDPATSPAELGQFFSETPIYIGPTRFCFAPPPYAPPVVTAPSRRGHPFTFGCFNRLSKINDEVLDAWGEILHRAPGSRLWLKSGALSDPWVRADLTARFHARGIDPARLVLSAGGGHGPMLEELSMIDLCLDPFPYTGGATSLESFWMGVPTLTVPGATMVSRQTHAMLVNLELAEHFSASGVRDYIERAVAYALHPEPLWHLRHTLRARMAASSLCDAAAFTRRLERFYHLAYEAALAGTKLPAYFAVDEASAEAPVRSTPLPATATGATSG